MSPAGSHVAIHVITLFCISVSVGRTIGEVSGAQPLSLACSIPIGALVGAGSTAGGGTTIIGGTTTGFGFSTSLVIVLDTSTDTDVWEARVTLFTTGSTSFPSSAFTEPRALKLELLVDEVVLLGFLNEASGRFDPKSIGVLYVANTHVDLLAPVLCPDSDCS